MAQIETVVKAIARARRVGFLGARSSFSIACGFRYAYNLIATNGVLFGSRRQMSGNAMAHEDRRGTRPMNNAKGLRHGSSQETNRFRQALVAPRPQTKQVQSPGEQP